MNLAMIILGVVLLIVIYFMYVRFFTTPMLAKYLGGSPGPIDMSTLTNPSSVRCSYCFWVYASSLSSSPGGGSNNLFKIQQTSDKSSTTYLSVDITNSANLQVTPTLSDDTTPSITLMNNFPMQTWKCVAISFDNKTLDVYLDGKIVRSIMMANNIKPPAATVGSSVVGSINWGNGDIYISNFQRFPSPMDPMTAWSIYINGNGGSGISSYGMEVALSKNNNITNKYTIF